MTVAKRPHLHRLAERVGEASRLDPLAEALGARVRGAIGPGPLKDALSGTWLGHALHPLMTDVPIGSWTSATILDLFGGRRAEDGADLLVAVGIATAVPTAVTGATEWADTERGDERTRRIGVIHAAANVASLACYSASLAARRGERRGVAKLLALGGLAALGAGGHLGGHLSYARGVGVDRTAFDQEPEDWVDTLPEAEVPAERAIRVDVAGVPVMLARDRSHIRALAASCSHRGGPLDEGELRDACVTCPWHGSVFRLDDGAVERGPSAYPQPAFETRVVDGRVQVRARTAAAESGEPLEEPLLTGADDSA